MSFPPADTSAPVVKPRILLSSGEMFAARGINVRWLAPDGITQQGGLWAANASTAEPLTRTFPGINMVRLAAFSNVADIGYATVTDMKPYIDTIIGQGIVVVLHCNTSAGTLVEPDLTTVTNWYAEFAVSYAASPMVWFASQSNPTLGYIANDAMLIAIYNAVRGSGNNALFLISSDIMTSSDTSGYSVETLAGLHNCAWDHHFYNSASNYRTDQDVNNAALVDAMNALWNMANIPIIVGEFGDASDGQNVDPGWQQVLQTVYDNPGFGSGYIQAWWNTPDDSAAFAGNQLLADPFDGTQLTQAGEMFRNALTAEST